MSATDPENPVPGGPESWLTRLMNCIKSLARKARQVFWKAVPVFGWAFLTGTATALAQWILRG
jgi:hypothetical protein